MHKPTLKVGDRVKFKAVTRWGAHTVTRKVKSIMLQHGCLIGLTVHYGGWSDFVVRPYEIIEVTEA